MQLGIGPSISKVATTMRTFGIKFIKDNLKLFFDFKNTDLEHVGTGSVNFDGTDDAVEVTPSTAIKNASEGTIALWFKIGGDAGANMALMSLNDVSDSDFCTIRLLRGSSTSFNLSFRCYVGSSLLYAINSTNMMDNKWHHVAMVVDTSGNRMYVDGINVALSYSEGGQSSSTQKFFSDVSDADLFTIGCTKNSSGHQNDFKGNISQVGIWNRGLSASEIQNIMHKTYSDLKGTELTHLQAWWKLDAEVGSDGNTGSGYILDEVSGVGSTTNLGTLTNNATLQDGIYGNNSPRKPRGVDNSKATLADQIGSGSASFDGSSDYVGCGTGLPDVTSGAFTILGWYKFDDVSSTNTLFSRGAGTSLHGYLLRYDTTPRLFAIQSKTTSYNYLTYNYTFENNKWYHIAWVNAGTGNESKLYLDGILVSSGTKSQDILTQSDQVFKIGSDLNGSNEFDGNIAQFGWFNAALTQEQIQSISQKTYSELSTNEKTNVDGSGGALISWWGLDSLHGQNAVEDKNGTESLGSEIVVNGEFTGTFDTTQDYSGDFDLVTGWRVHTAGSGGSPHTATEGDNNGSQAVRIISTSSLSTNYINVRSKVAIELTAGTLYKLTFDAKKESTQTFMRIKTASGANIAYQPVAGGLDAEVTLTDTMTTYTYYFRPTVTDTTSYIAFGRKSGDSASNFTIDNISLKTVTGSNVGELL